MKEPKVIYVCHPCNKEFNLNELPDMMEFDEEGDWDYSCPNCKERLEWSLG